MQTIKIYGASDDLVEVEGNVPGCDEFNDTPLYIELSLGDVFKVEYTKGGVWTVEHVKRGGLKAAKGKIIKEPHGDGDDPEPYTETVTITAPVEWVEAWKDYPPTVEEMRWKLERFLSGNDGFDEDRFLSDDDVRAIWAIVATARRRRTA